MKMLNSKGDITDPCGTPARQGFVVDNAPGSFVCCVLFWWKLWIHYHKHLLIFLFFKEEWNHIPDRMPYWNRWIKTGWLFPSGLLSVSLNHVWVMLIRADRHSWSTLWEGMVIFFDSQGIYLFRDIWRAGSIDICLKSDSMFSGGYTLSVHELSESVFV